MTLRDLRRQSKKTTTEIAAALGVTPQAVSNYESGQRRLNIEQVIPLADLFDVSERDIIEAQLKSIKLP